MTTMIESDHAQLLAKLDKANERAKAIARRGYCGTISKEYRVAHDHLNWLLTRLGY